MNREEMILSLKPQVERSARKIWKKSSFHGILTSLEDLTSYAWIGAINAVDTYNPDRNPNILLGYFASKRIFGAIFDYMRGTDHMSRPARKKQKNGLKDDPFETRIAWDGSEENWRAGFDVIEANSDIEKILETCQLPLRDQEILIDFYFEGQTLKQIGKKFDISEGRVSQCLSEIRLKIFNRILRNGRHNYQSQ